MTGGMYLNDGIPQGLYVENGPVEKPLNTLQKAYGDFYLQPNDVFGTQKNVKPIVATSDNQQLLN
ncbi:MAG: hypothetical protein ACJAXY_000694 [Nonlabens sp.]|jgi:uncharacterized protein YigE (DUF2233 family)|uniref:hypothetical protein n=1 Tax=Nonlabens sp. TaxID=1888209 RepID=UPI0039E5A6BF